jgi:hypothetical protein
MILQAAFITVHNTKFSPCLETLIEIYMSQI